MRARPAAIVAFAVATAGCVDTYCQSGSKYGTQCRTGADLQLEQRQQGRTPMEPVGFWGTRPPPAPTPAPAGASSSFFSPGWRPPPPKASATAASSAPAPSSSSDAGSPPP